VDFHGIWQINWLCTRAELVDFWKFRVVVRVRFRPVVIGVKSESEIGKFSCGILW